MSRFAQRRGGWLLGAIALGLSLAIVGVSNAEILQGRLLQRSDGALFIIRDGAKFAVPSADLSDDDINAIPDGDGGLFPASASGAPAVSPLQPVTSPPTAPSNPPAPQLAADVNLITFSGNIKVAAAPAPFSVAKQQDGLVIFSEPVGSEIDVVAVPGARDTDSLLQAAKQQFEALQHLKPDYGLVQKVSTAGKVTSMSVLPFQGQATSSTSGLVFYSGSLVAVMRPDLPIVVISAALDGFERDTAAPLAAVIASLEQ